MFRSLIGKIFGDKIDNFTGLKSTLSSLWNLEKPLRIRELGVNLYKFFFDNRQDKLRILNGIGWSFDSQFLILKEWDEHTDFSSAAFNKIFLWVQIWNLPPHWLSRALGFKFRSLFNDVVDVLIPEGGSKKGCHLKVLAEIDLGKPLLRGSKIRLDSQSVWVEFKYEKIASFCFYFGRVGHQEKACSYHTGDARIGKLQPGQYGLWMQTETTRAPPISPSSSQPPKAAPRDSTPIVSPIPHCSESVSPQMHRKCLVLCLLLFLTVIYLLLYQNLGSLLHCQTLG